MESDSKKIVYMDRKNRVNLLDVASGKVSLLLQDPVGVPGGVTFSPDGEWLTYTRMGKMKSMSYMSTTLRKRKNIR